MTRFETIPSPSGKDTVTRARTTGQMGANGSTVGLESRLFDKEKEAIISIAEAAALLGRHRKTVESWIRNAGLPHRRIPGAKKNQETVEIFLSELVAWLDRQKGIKLVK